MRHDKKFRAEIIALTHLQAKGIEPRGFHLVQKRNRKGQRTLRLVSNRIQQAPYMPAPPKGHRYARDPSKSGNVPMLVRLAG